jgi:hypothetical protein
MQQEWTQCRTYGRIGKALGLPIQNSRASSMSITIELGIKTIQDFQSHVHFTYHRQTRWPGMSHSVSNQGPSIVPHRPSSIAVTSKRSPGDQQKFTHRDSEAIHRILCRREPLRLIHAVMLGEQFAIPEWDSYGPRDSLPPLLAHFVRGRESHLRTVAGRMIYNYPVGERSWGLVDPYDMVQSLRVALHRLRRNGDGTGGRDGGVYSPQ